MWAPKGTPKNVIAALNAAAVDAMVDPVVRARTADLGWQFPSRSEQTPEALGALHKAEIEKWWPFLHLQRWLERRYLSRRVCALCDTPLDRGWRGAIHESCWEKVRERRCTDCLKHYRPRRRLRGSPMSL
jgi:hypothetical protein